MIEKVSRAMLCAAAVLITTTPAAALGLDHPEETRDAAALYTERCAACHDHPGDRIPPKISLAIYRTPDEIIEALSTGVMRQQASGLSAREIRSLAIHITGREPAGTVGPAPNANLCRTAAPQPALVVPQPGDWNGWGPDLTNARFQMNSGLTARNVLRLKLKWAFAYPSQAAFAQPTVVGSYLFTTGAGRYVFALDAHSGCTYWAYRVGALVRTAALAARLPGRDGRLVVWFGDDRARIHALDARTGELLWITRIDEHSAARILSTPTYHDGRIYVGVSSNEEIAAADPKYGCCTFRGSVVALQGKTGSVLWKHYVVQEEPRPTRRNAVGTQMFGPAGGAVFSSPTIDARRGVLYAGTGDGYTSERSDSTDAIIAVDLDAGKRRWTSQVRSGDSWIVGCGGSSPGPNCPSPLGEDYDFAASPMLITRRDGTQLVIAGAKSGVLYAFDVQVHGRPAWQLSVAPGSSHGAILWGTAADAQRVYVATTEYDPTSLTDTSWGRGIGGLSAISLATGGLIWHERAPAPGCGDGHGSCSQGQTAAVTALPGIVFSGALDGRLSAHAARDGKVIWEFYTARDFQAVNGGIARGGGIDYGGQVLAHDMLFVHSGSQRAPGNALLAFSVDGR